MKPKHRKGQAWLLATAKEVAATLNRRRKGNVFRIRMPVRTKETDTDGWSVVIGDLGKNRPRLELWLDHFSGYTDRKLYAGFSSTNREQIEKLVTRKLWPVREVTLKDIAEVPYFILAERLRRSQFTQPVLEKYDADENYYGIYDPTHETTDRLNRYFCSRAVAFFTDVISALPNEMAENETYEDYSDFENRKKVVSHLRRERSHLLAADCKIRDNYECQVCGFRYEKIYGRIGKGFAEAHHKVPLSQLRENVRTSLDDLVTVCANCHRMLHRMSGRREDIIKLRAIVRRHSQSL